MKLHAFKFGCMATLAALLLVLLIPTSADCRRGAEG